MVDKSCFFCVNFETDSQKEIPSKHFLQWIMINSIEQDQNYTEGVIKELFSLLE